MIQRCGESKFADFILSFPFSVSSVFASIKLKSKTDVASFGSQCCQCWSFRSVQVFQYLKRHTQYSTFRAKAFRPDIFLRGEDVIHF